MARARNIKPSFFTNDELAEIAPIGRLLFIGLWTLADREGRLEDRPKRIKAQLFAYDDVDCDALLDDLQRLGFILRYAACGMRCIYILNFGKHQMPHHKEAASELPPPDGMPAVTRHSYDVPPSKRDEIFERDGRKCLRCGSKESLSLDHITPLSAGGTNDDNNLQTLCKRCNSSKGSATRDHRFGNVAATLNQASADESASCPSDSGFPLTDSGFPLTDSPSLIPDSSSLRSPGARATPVELSIAMRQNGIESQPADPRLIALAEQGVSVETVEAACKTARSAKPNERISPAYIVAIIERWAKDAAGIHARGATVPPARASPQRKGISAAAESGLALAGYRKRAEVIDV